MAAVPPDPHPGTPPEIPFEPTTARNGLSGFFFSGLATAFLGAILPAWRYHIQPDYLLIGAYFLLLAIGILAGTIGGNLFLKRFGIGTGIRTAAAIMVGALGLLAASGPPASPYWRLLGLLLLGAATGLFNSSSLHSLAGAYRLHPAATANLVGVVFGLGCLLTVVLVAGAFFIYTVPSIILWMAVLAVFALIHYSKLRFPPDPVLPHPSWRDTLNDLKNPSAVLFALLLFFAWGNEGAFAGWLSLYLILRLGISPPAALFLLALFWGSLLIGRVAAQALLPRVSHARLLAGAVVAPIFGCLLLFFTNNISGATVGVLLCGSGFSVILPLVTEKIGHRYPYYQPGFFNGIFSIGLIGGLLAPASLGLFAEWYDVRAVMALPLIGSFMVFLLLLLIFLEDRISGRSTAT